jgi:hypothetical protein
LNGVLFFAVFALGVFAAFLTADLFRFTGARFAFSEDTVELTASFRRAKADFAS